MSAELSPLAIPDFPGFVASLTDRGYALNPCRDHCPETGEHAHLKDPHGDDMIAWADGRWSGYDLTQPARCIYPAAPKRLGMPFRNDGGVRA